MMDWLYLAVTYAPVPRELSLSLPLNAEALKVLLVIAFMPHLLFANLTVGGTLLAVVFELIGLGRPKYDALAQKCSKVVTVSKSMAVVLGVGPLLCINLVYAEYFYAANILTGNGWLSVVPLLMTGFILSYAYSFFWNFLRGTFKAIHILLGVSSLAVFLTVPVIFLANANLMLFPYRWEQVSGFLSSLFIGNVFPRYLHFVTASIALTGLFIAGWYGKYSDGLSESGFPKLQIRRLGYGICFFASLCQFAFGPLVLLTLPSHGIKAQMVGTIFTGVLFAVFAMMLLWNELQSEDRDCGRHFWLIVLMLTVTVGFMLTGRHMYREDSLADHRIKISEKTQNFRNELARFQGDLISPESSPAAEPAAMKSDPEKSFRTYCGLCHKESSNALAPSISEIRDIYEGDVYSVVEWAKNPSKKRNRYSAMPSFSHLSERELKSAVEYMLNLKLSDETADMV